MHIQMPGYMHTSMPALSPADEEYCKADLTTAAWVAHPGCLGAAIGLSDADGYSTGLCVPGHSKHAGATVLESHLNELIFAVVFVYIVQLAL